MKAFLASAVIPSLEEITADEDIRLLRQMKMMMREQKPFALRSHLRAMKSLIVKTALKGVKGNKVQAARLLGLTESTLRQNA